MQRQKRRFYIIGHNPNTIEEAKEYLDNGANALEPDIVHSDGRFYVSHSLLPSYENVPTVEDYLQSLKALIAAHQYDLALIVWDMKHAGFDINHFISIVKENFDGGACDGVAMLMTHADDIDFVNRYSGNFENVGIGVDESDTPPGELQEIYKRSSHKNFSYADGITTLLNKPGVFKNVTEAQQCRRKHEPDSFKIIYTWVLSMEASIRKYLDSYMDGIMVDAGAVKLLKELIDTAPYNDVYELAKNGYNPFTAAAVPAYTLSVKTSDKFLAGTDATFLFTLTGTSGEALKSLPYNSSIEGRLERGSTSYITLEGLNLGEIKSITVEALTDGIGAGWLPEEIYVESKLINQQPIFTFNLDGEHEWISKKSGAVIKYAG
ncbi:MAG: PLAT/LH2 domain-containing protein [Ferruginibacter sp.]